MKYLEIPLREEGSLGESKIQAYILDTPAESLKLDKRPLIIICPGGAYERISFREGEPVAMHFLNRGYHVMILRYSCTPARFPTPLLELGYAMKLAHEKADEWKIDINSIVVQGASAGGHLAGMLGVFWNKEWFAKKMGVNNRILRPAAMILSYPVVSARNKNGHVPSFLNLLGTEDRKKWNEFYLDENVNSDVPPTFIWHTITDGTVPVQNSIDMTLALKNAGVPVELHLFSEGEHGLSLATDELERPDGSGCQKQCRIWIQLADSWLDRWLKKEKYTYE